MNEEEERVGQREYDYSKLPQWIEDGYVVAGERWSSPSLSLVFATEHCHWLPNSAVAFLSFNGLPRPMFLRTLQTEIGKNMFSSEISFEHLFKPLDMFNTG